MFDPRELLERFGSFVIPLVLSLTVHEWAHAWSANLLGDRTAEAQGRLTLNPLAHIDPLGTIILPLLGIPFGWAKPVPVNMANFRRDVPMRTGMMITAAAGPASNVLIALVSAVLFGLSIRFGIGEGHMELFQFLQTMMTLNVLLAVFNMLPIYPLDGSRVVDGLISHKLRPAWERYCQYGPMVLLGVIVLPSMIGFSVTRWPMMIALEAIMWVTRLVAGF